MSVSRGESRHWPIFVAGILGIILIALVLPNPLWSRPDTTQALAEYAPVPGPGHPGAANFATVRFRGAGGFGSAPAPAPEPSSVPRLREFHPRQKHCVGNPPRQTEDPLSPPCVPFFDGDNGGATWRGVTRDRVEVVLYAENLHKEIDLTKPWRPSDEAPPGRNEITQANLVRTMKAHLRYFQHRYQTYGRQVRVVARPGGGASMSATRAEDEAGAPTCSDRKASARETVRREPFAVLRLGFYGADCYRRVILDAGIMMFGINYEIPRARYEQYAPLHWGLFPDQETTAAHTAEFFCRSLRGRPARFANDPTLRGVTRRFAVLYPQVDYRSSNFYGPEHRQAALLTVAEAEARCGLPIEPRAYPENDFTTVLVDLKRAGVTTIHCKCIAWDIPAVQRAATAIAYYPEWYFDIPLVNATYAKTLVAREQGGFGVLARWRQPAFREQRHYQAYGQMEPGTRPNPEASSEIYHTFHMLFSGIQAAGPILAPEAVQRGMFTLRFVDPRNAWVPSGGWGPYGRHPTSTYTFIDTSMAVWWDPNGTQPGGRPAEGCIRAALVGRRFYPDQWPADDSMLYEPNQPCYAGDIEFDDL